jgi:hypothetical protein
VKIDCEITDEQKAQAAQESQELRQRYLADWKAKIEATTGQALSPSEEAFLAAMVPHLQREGCDVFIRGYLQGITEAAALIGASAKMQKSRMLELVAEMLPEYGQGSAADFCTLYQIPYPTRTGL